MFLHKKKYGSGTKNALRKLFPKCIFFAKYVATIGFSLIILSPIFMSFAGFFFYLICSLKYFYLFLSIMGFFKSWAMKFIVIHLVEYIMIIFFFDKGYAKRIFKGD